MSENDMYDRLSVHRTHGPEASENPSALLSDLDREAHEWLTRFAGGAANRSDLVSFKEWAARDKAHTEAFERACRLWKTVGPAHDLLAVGSRKRSGAIGRRAFLGGAMAASAAGVAYLAVRPPLELWPSLKELAADYRTAPGQRKSIALADGISLELNTRTSISVTASADRAERIALLGGEVEIAAAGKGSLLEVAAGDGHASAVRAVFNMRFSGDMVRTTCLQGDVEVFCLGDSVRLQPNEQVVYSPAGFEPVSHVRADVVSAWKKGILEFQSTPLSQAIDEINRYRSGPIILTDPVLGRRLFSARLQIANIDNVVAQIQEVFGIGSTSLPGGIVLLG